MPELAEEQAPKKKAAPRKPKYIGTIEICRSFSFKVNRERYEGAAARYESMDFFMSHKAECMISDAEKTSEALHQFCKSQVMKAVGEYIASLAPRGGK